MFLIPAFSAWFFSYAQRDTDQKILVQVESSIQRDTRLTPEVRAENLEFFRRVPVSRIMASSKPEAAELQRMFESVNLDYATFRWMKRIAWLCLATIFVTLIIVGLSVAFSLRSHAAQYYSLRIGWPVLQVSSAIQVLGQAILAAALSYWVTAIFANLYSVKLVGAAGVLAALAVFALLKAVFTKPSDRFDVDGEVITETDAPGLWLRVREMAAKLKTAPPDRIIVGIAPSFFVTEHPVTRGPQTLSGRTLYLSLPMIKILAASEADAVLGHELAHFSGEDTLWSRKISPLTNKFAIYLDTLANGLSLIVAQFMLAFWKLYGLSMRKLSRAREFRADQIGASVSSNDSMKRALVKVASYCEYRADTEREIMNRYEISPDLNLALQLEQGYPTYLTAFSQKSKAADERIPHPFDTHPTLSNRLEHLGFETRAALNDPDLHQGAPDSWYQEILTASALEEQMWRQQQDAMQGIHNQDIPWRLLPNGEEETAIVRKYFPITVFRKKNGAEITLDVDRILISEHGTPILFRDIFEVRLQNAWMKKRYTLFHRPNEHSRLIGTQFFPASFKGDSGDLLNMFAHYYNRYKTAEVRSQQPAV